LARRYFLKDSSGKNEINQAVTANPIALIGECPRLSAFLANSGQLIFAFYS
jgi:hypothetical protein